MLAVLRGLCVGVASSDASSLVHCLQLAGSLVHRLWGPGVCLHMAVEFGGAGPVHGSEW